MKKYVDNKNILDKLVDALEGRLPNMNKQEKKEYRQYTDEQKQGYNELLIYIDKNVIENQVKEKITKMFINYTELINAMNGLLNDLYYKDGVRDCVKILIESVIVNVNIKK